MKEILARERRRDLLMQRSDELQPESKNENPAYDNVAGGGFGEGKLVVAIDINGNRELTAVEQVLARVMRCWEPELIVVKSRSLYSKMIEMGY